jgi:hypothetical protein
MKSRLSRPGRRLHALVACVVVVSAAVEVPPEPQLIYLGVGDSTVYAHVDPSIFTQPCKGGRERQLSALCTSSDGGEEHAARGYETPLEVPGLSNGVEFSCSLSACCNRSVHERKSSSCSARVESTRFIPMVGMPRFVAVASFGSSVVLPPGLSSADVARCVAVATMGEEEGGGNYTKSCITVAGREAGGEASAGAAGSELTAALAPLSSASAVVAAFTGTDGVPGGVTIGAVVNARHTHAAGTAAVEEGRLLVC